MALYQHEALEVHEGFCVLFRATATVMFQDDEAGKRPKAHLLVL